MRRQVIRAIFYALCLATLVTACGKKGGGRAVPRPDAWPRVDTYPASYHNIPGVSVNFQVNDSTVIKSTNKTEWVTVRYPRYHANLHLTFTRVSPGTLDGVVDNRVERMALNSGGNESIITELTNRAGFKAQLMRTPRGSITPLQILAINNNIVVSGALELANAEDLQRPDSLAPVIDAIEADLLYALKTLQ